MTTKHPPDHLPGPTIPEIQADAHRRQLKIMLFSAQKSAALAVWLVAVPCFFLFGVAMKHYFHYDVGLLTIMQELVSSMDRSSGFPLSILLFVGLPIVVIVTNFLSIIHVALDSIHHDLVVSIKLRWQNIALTFLAFCLLGIFMLYGLIETLHHTL
jgi:hypothetical protein